MKYPTQNKKPCGVFLKAAWLFILLAFFAPPAFADPYIDNLVEKASELKLHEKRDWLVLMHYKKTVRGFESLIDDPEFFLSKDGKRNPKNELDATVRAFFSTEESGDRHPQCRFIARFNWLKTELAISEEKLPKEQCAEFDELWNNLKPESAVLIFPVSHMNSPASMFGHTLLRIDSSAESKLLSYAVNYSAFTNETNGMLFAVKGIFGYYEGFFGILPYYEKIKEYSSMENRDMWEYRLNFTPEEVRKIVLHMWELRSVYSYYYFFDENCSYNLLLVLEAGRPDVELSDMLPPWVIPMDTIRAVQKTKLDKKELVYRPAKATRIRFIEERTEPRFQYLAMDVAEKKVSPDEVFENSGITREDRIKTLDLSAEYLQYSYSKKKIGKDEYLKLYLSILAARSKAGKADSYEIPTPAPPEAGHGSSRAAVGIGARKGAVYQSLRLRPANHDLTDPDAGYLPGAAITFMDTEVRYNYTERKFSLERFTLVDIVSIAERGRFFKPISWKINTGIEREEFEKRAHRTTYRINGGPGLSYRFMANGLAYSFIEPEAKFSNSLEDGYSIGIGASVGILKPITPMWKIQFEGRAVGFGAGDRHSIYSAELNQRFTINPNSAIKFGIKREKFDRFLSNDINLSLNLYF
ncbi:MAG: DUF4105 domain-containing protein [Deltaproteobacteria bacterium]|nr:DUF4105 domain-containing protein [Deltaproteobacteria bacterium]